MYKSILIGKCKGKKGVAWLRKDQLNRQMLDERMRLIFNLSMLPKQAWRMHQTSATLWVCVLKGIYFQTMNFSFMLSYQVQACFVGVVFMKASKLFLNFHGHGKVDINRG